MSSDISDFEFIIAPDLQIWTNDNIIVKLLEAGLQKIAYVSSPDLFAQISVEQTLDEDIAQDFPSAQFKTIDDAMDWLK